MKIERITSPIEFKEISKNSLNNETGNALKKDLNIPLFEIRRRACTKGRKYFFCRSFQRADENEWRPKN